MRQKRVWYWLGIVFVFFCVSALAIFTGPGGISFNDVKYLLVFRILRLVIGICAGGVLGVVGAALQGLLGNPLVDPWTLGVASGAAFGATLAMVSGMGSSVVLPVAGFIGALVAIGLVYLFARTGGVLPVTRLVLAGVVVSFLFSSLVMLVIVLSRRTIGEAVYLMMGSLGVVVTRGSVKMLIGSLFLALVGCGWLIFHARELDIISFNEEVALSLGVDTPRLTKAVFLVGSLGVAMVVVWTGAIGFIGLIVPHLVRMLFGPRHSVVLPGSFLLGAGLLITADLVARSLAPSGLPLSVVTALIGVPFFIYILRTRV